MSIEEVARPGSVDWNRATLAMAALVFGIALVLRAFYLWTVWDTPSLHYPMGDAEMYHEKALAILAGDWIGSRAFFQDPLYPYFLAVLYGLFGESLGLVLGAQALLGSGTALLVFRIGVGLFGNGRGLLAGLLAASYGVAIYYDGLPLKVTLSLFLATLALQQVLRADALSTGERVRGRLARGHWFSGGLALGLAVLTRGNFLIFVPVLLAWVWLGTGPGARRVAATATAAAGIALAVLPATLHNAVASGHFVLTTSQAGQIFYLGNFRGNRSGTFEPPPFMRSHPRYEEEDLRAEGERRAGRALSPSELSRFWFREGLAEILADPAHFLRHGVRKLELFSNDYEVPDNYSFDYFREQLSFVLRLPLPSWGVVFPLSLCGMAFSMRDRRKLLLVLYVASYVLTVAVFYTSSRYRMPVAPVAQLFAAEAAFQIGRRLFERDWRRGLPALVFLAIAWPLGHRDVVDSDLVVQRYRVKLGIQHARRADAARETAIDRVAAGDGVGAGSARMRDAELSGLAEREFRAALDRWPDNEHFQRMFAKHMTQRIDALDALGDSGEALEAAQLFVATLPAHPAAQVRLGAMYARAGRLERAREILERAVADYPNSVRARIELRRLSGSDDSPPGGS